MARSEYRRVEAYIEALPAGLDSHPTCIQRGSIPRTWLARQALTDSQHLPDVLRRHIVDLPKNSAWVPEVHANALYLAQCDEHFSSDDAFIEFCYEMNLDFFRSPVYRALKTLASPAAFLQTLRLMWKLFRKETTFTMSAVGDTEVHIRLGWPRHAMPELIARCLGTAFRACLETAKPGQGVRAEMVSFGAEGAEYVVAPEGAKR